MGASSINIKELAQYCKVSVSTVSRVFSGTTYVNPKTKEKVLLAARELHYNPQQTSAKNNIALIVPSKQAIQPPSWFAATLATTLLREIYHAGFAPRLYDSEDIQLIQPNFNIAAISLNWSPSEKQSDYLISMQRPLISLNMVMPFAHSVCSSHAGETELAMRYLLERGHRKIALLNPEADLWGNNERINSYKKILQEHMISLDSMLIGGENSDGGLSMDKLLQMLRNGATAFLCLHEDWTMPLHYYLTALGKRIPEDISVISAEVAGMNQWLDTPQTAVCQDLTRLSQEVIAILRQIDNDEFDNQNLKHIEVPCTLIERSSVKKI